MNSCPRSRACVRACVRARVHASHVSFALFAVCSLSLCSVVVQRHRGRELNQIETPCSRCDAMRCDAMQFDSNVLPKNVPLVIHFASLGQEGVKRTHAVFAAFARLVCPNVLIQLLVS
jgi:hypothetical protein